MSARRQKEDTVGAPRKLPRGEFQSRIARLREVMSRDGTDIFIVYGDEYRRENLRYVSNYWPIFERGLLFVGMDRDPILLASPECEHLARDMSAWPDVRLVREVGMSYVPEEVDFTNIRFTTVRDVAAELQGSRKSLKVKICGIDAMSVVLYERLKGMLDDAVVENGDPILYGLRLVKTPAEVEMLKEAWRVCDSGYKAVLDTDIVGLTEGQAAAIGEKAARDAGAEHVAFSIFCAGERTNTVVGRPSQRVIRKGDMIMYALAVQYEGYIASDEWPFVAGGKAGREQESFIRALVAAEDMGAKAIRPGVPQGEVVRKIRDFFREQGLEQYDLYPPIHGNGLAEAESPYPDEKTTSVFAPGIGFNFDVSLFGHPVAGSNRIEEGFIVTDTGLLTLSPLISGLRERYLAGS
jgi:Xaa-Pro aminopeptidase